MYINLFILSSILFSGLKEHLLMDKSNMNSSTAHCCDISGEGMNECENVAALRNKTL